MIDSLSDFFGVGSGVPLLNNRHRDESQTVGLSADSFTFVDNTSLQIALRGNLASDFSLHVSKITVNFYLSVLYIYQGAARSGRILEKLRLKAASIVPKVLEERRGLGVGNLTVKRRKR